MQNTRYELKFIIDAQAKNQILDVLEHGLQVDSSGDRGSYRVTSLYFDSPNYKALWEKLDGVPIREKFRLRYYGDSPEDPASGHPFLEIKRRYFQLVVKHRLSLERGEALDCLDGETRLSDLSFNPTNDDEQELASRVRASAERDFLSGAVLITYVREAWVGVVDRGLRVTFDHFCQSFPAHARDEATRGNGARLLDETQMILEVKFNKRVPRWLRDGLRSCRVRPVRFSKYAEGLMAYLGPSMRAAR